MTNDNELYLKEFLGTTNGNFETTYFKDALFLTDNPLIRLTVGVNNSIMNKCDSYYVTFKGAMAKEIDLSKLSDSYTFGLFIRGEKLNWTTQPYNVCLLADDKMTFGYMTELLNQHHFRTYNFDNLASKPTEHQSKHLGFNVRACTFDGKTTMEKVTFNSYIEHKNATELIMKTLPDAFEL